MVRRCKATTPDGKPCRMAPLDGQDYCWAHSPENKENHKAAARKGGQNARAVTLPASAPKVELETAEDAPRLIATTIDQVRTGQLGVKIGEAIGRLVTVWLKAYDQAILEKRLSELENPDDVDEQTYAA